MPVKPQTRSLKRLGLNDLILSAASFGATVTIDIRKITGYETFLNRARDCQFELETDGNQITVNGRRTCPFDAIDFANIEEMDDEIEGQSPEAANSM